MKKATSTRTNLRVTKLGWKPHIQRRHTKKGRRISRQPLFYCDWNEMKQVPKENPWKTCIWHGWMKKKMCCFCKHKGKTPSKKFRICRNREEKLFGECLVHFSTLSWANFHGRQGYAGPCLDGYWKCPWMEILPPFSAAPPSGCFALVWFGLVLLYMKSDLPLL